MNVNVNWMVEKCCCESKKHRICEKDFIWNPDTNPCGSGNGRYLVLLMIQ